MDSDLAGSEGGTPTSCGSPAVNLLRRGSESCLRGSNDPEKGGMLASTAWKLIRMEVADELHEETKGEKDVVLRVPAYVQLRVVLEYLQAIMGWKLPVERITFMRTRSSRHSLDPSRMVYLSHLSSSEPLFLKSNKGDSVIMSVVVDGTHSTKVFVDEFMTAFGLCIKMLRKYCQTETVRDEAERFQLFYEAPEKDYKVRKRIPDDVALKKFVTKRSIDSLFVDTVTSTPQARDAQVTLRIFNPDGWILNEEADPNSREESAAASPSPQKSKRRFLLGKTVSKQGSAVDVTKKGSRGRKLSFMGGRPKKEDSSSNLSKTRSMVDTQSSSDDLFGGTTTTAKFFGESPTSGKRGSTARAVGRINSLDSTAIEDWVFFRAKVVTHTFDKSANVEQVLRTINRIYSYIEDIEEYGLALTSDAGASVDSDMDSSMEGSMSDTLEWLRNEHTLEFLHLQDDSTVHFRARATKYTVRLPNGSTIPLKFDQTVIVSELFEMLVFNMKDDIKDSARPLAEIAEEYGIYVDEPGGVMLDFERALSSYTDTAYVFQAHKQPLTVTFEGNQFEFLIDYWEPLDATDILMDMLEAMGLERNLSSQNYMFGELGINGKPISPHVAFAEQGVYSPAKIMFKSFVSGKDGESALPDDDVNIFEEASDSSTVIWEDEKSVERNGIRIGAGTLNKLVEYLTSHETSNVTFMKAFIITFMSFTTPAILLAKLLQRYHVPVEKSQYSAVIKIRVINVLKYWIDTRLEDFTEAMLTTVDNFVRMSLGSEASLTYSRQCQSILHRIHKNRHISLQTSSRRRANSVARAQRDGINQKSSGQSRSVQKTVWSFSDEEIAEAMTQISFDLWRSVKVTEFLDLSWTKAHTQWRCPNLMRMIDRFNFESAWVSFQVIHPERVKHRAKIWERMLRMAEILRKKNNLQSAMAIISGLNNSSVSRMKFTRKLVPKKLLEKQAELEKLLSPEKSFKNLRDAMADCSPPAIPYVGLYLSDLTFIEEGNPNEINGLINFSKRFLLYEVIQQVQQYQQGIAEGIEPNFDISKFLYDFERLSDNDLYKLSRLREGKDKRDVI